MPSEPHPEMSDMLRRIAVGPAMSKNLSREEARRGMQLILDGQVDPVQAAVYLIALRMKRETLDENLGVLAALRDATHFATADVPVLAELADPYDGFERHTPVSPFLPPLLAACGLPTVSHGCVTMPPKNGVTHAQILAATGKAISLSPDEAARQIEHERCGWAYVDQSRFSPAQADLLALRRLIVKRPCLSTLEKLCSPVRTDGRFHLIIGYVHSAYRTLLMELSEAGDWDSALIVKGAEGGVIPKMQRPESLHRRSHLEDDELRDWTVDPTRFDFDAPEPMPPVPAELPAGLAAHAAECGLAALAGQHGQTRDALVWGAGIILNHTDVAPNLRDGIEFASKMIDKGRAMAHFNAAP